MSKDKRISSTSCDRKEIFFDNGESKVYADKNGKPVVATKYIERLKKKQLKESIEYREEVRRLDLLKYEKEQRLSSSDF